MAKTCKFKCRTRVNTDELTDDDDVIKEFLRKDFLKFFITIYNRQSLKSNDY